MLTDAQLLRQYVKDHSEPAFTELVQRHVDLVYSAALREASGDKVQAEDLTQAVFCELARNAAALCRHPAVPGWLYTCVRHVAANQRRADQRRHQREQTAYAMSELQSSKGELPEWQQVGPVLDDAMHELNDHERAVVVLRFFEDRSLREVGEALGLNENAARMRVDRALEKLRGLLARRGVQSTTAGLATVLTASSILSAPTGLAASVVTSALAGAGVSAAASSLTLFQIMSLTKIQMGLVAAVLVAGVSVPIWQETRVRRVKAENQELQTQVTELLSARAEVKKLEGVQADRAELERLRASQTAMQEDAAKLRGRLRTALVNQAAPPPRDTVGGTNKEAEGMPAAMGDLMKGAMEMQVSGKIARMKTKLNLSPDQEQAIRELLQKQMEPGATAMQAMFSGKLSKMSKDEIAALRKSAPNTEDQIKALLAPDQLAAYQDYKQEDAVTQARVVANAELLQLHNALGLTQEQQDKVYTALYQQTVDQLSGKIATPTPPTADFAALMQWQLDQKAKALEGVLSPEQLQTYRQFQAQQAKAVASMMPSNVLNAAQP